MPAVDDAGSDRAGSIQMDTAFVAVFAALAAVMSFIAIPVGPVPITLQTLGVTLAGVLLGPVRGFLAIALWIVVGLLGLPVFSGGTSGLSVLAGPTAGYLLSFPFAAALAGALVPVFRRLFGGRSWGGAVFCAGLLGLLLSHVAGIAGLVLGQKMVVGEAIGVDLVFWPGDLAKNLLAALIAVAVFRAFPRIRSGLQ